MRDYSKLEKLSPFEIKDELISLATQTLGDKFLNAGRGNPNFIATIPREGFFQLGLFALQEAERFFSYVPGLGATPESNGIDLRFDIFLNANPTNRGNDFLKRCLAYLHEKMGISKKDILVEFVNGILGDNYPVPPRVLKYTEKIASKYILQEMAYKQSIDTVDLMATEGGTAAMTYIFQSLSKNGVVKKGDKVALGMPIFVPYIEITHLSEYQLVQIGVEASHESNWQYSDKELEKLLDPEVKVFCLVNPTNPASVKVQEKTLKKLAEITKQRPDLIIVTDDVYATFSENFESIFAICPYNTLLVYSYSKYFGATGWRLGSIVLHKHNVIDDLIKKLPDATKKELNHRYSPIAIDPDNMKFIDRMVADSRSIGLNHTAGPSTPQQIQMTLFSISELMDESGQFKAAMKRMKHDRYKSLYQGIGIEGPHDSNDVHYYHIVPMAYLGGVIYGKDFTSWLETNKKSIQVLFDLAELGLVLLPADGFGVKEALSVRVSLSNSTAADCEKVGLTIRSLIDKYYKEYKN